MDAVARMRANIPDVYHGAYRKVYDKAMTGRSLRAAVNSKCLDCVCWEREEVKKCPSIDCPLYSYRPYKGG